MKITFCGHREIDGAPALPLLLEQCLRAQLSAGATEFFFGGIWGISGFGVAKSSCFTGAISGNSYGACVTISSCKADSALL